MAEVSQSCISFLIKCILILIVIILRFSCPRSASWVISPMDRDTSIVIMKVKGNTELILSYSILSPVSIKTNC